MGITENDPVIPRGGAILALIWHLFGTDFLSANPSQRGVLRVPRWLQRSLFWWKAGVPFEVVGEIIETRTIAIGRGIRELRACAAKPTVPVDGGR
jgi:hypothetical protein